jgi:hypothetical protein
VAALGAQGVGAAGGVTLRPGATRLVAIPIIAIVRTPGQFARWTREGGVRKQFRQASAFASAMMAVGILACVDASALEFADISGKWCTAGGSERFDRDNLIAIPTSTGERRVYPIVRYDFAATQVTVTWKDAKGESVHTDFAEFSTDRRRMVQVASEAGPRREFRRC